MNKRWTEEEKAGYRPVIYKTAGFDYTLLPAMRTSGNSLVKLEILFAKTLLNLPLIITVQVVIS